MTEFEKKMQLSKTEYDYLMEHVGYDGPLFGKPIVKQINYYFDTDDLSMNRQNITCRIRLKEGKYNGTMKKHYENGDQSTEIKMEVRNGIHDNAFIDMGLKLQGELTTYRCSLLKDKYFEVFLDKNEYLNTIDYELEVEYLPGYEKDAQAILKIFRDMLTRLKYHLIYKESIINRPSTPSKSKRFFKKKTTIYEYPNNAKTSPSHKNCSDHNMDSYPYLALNDQDMDENRADQLYNQKSNKRDCGSCIYRNGTSCGAECGKCKYEHY